MTFRASRPISRFALSFQGEAFLVPKQSLFGFFETHPELIVSHSYDVQSSVSSDIFREFVSSLDTDSELTVTPENAAALGLLASEFSFDDLAAECAKLAQDPVAAIEDRLAKLEARVPFPPHSERLELHERRIAELFCRMSLLETLETTVSELAATVSEMQRRPMDPGCRKAIPEVGSSRRDFQGDIETSQRDPQREVQREIENSQRDSQREVQREIEKSQREFQRELAELKATVGRIRDDCAAGNDACQTRITSVSEFVSSHKFDRVCRKREDPLDGIFAFLTAKCGRNIQDAGLVQATCSSGQDHHIPYWLFEQPDTPEHFGTRSETNPFLCFEFRDYWIIPREYTILTDHSDSAWTAHFMTSWVIEVSMDGSIWEVIDERQNSQQINGPDRTATFVVRKVRVCKLLRIRRTSGTIDSDPSLQGHHSLEMKRFEFFGRLLEL
jgi:hypothetical protein